MVKRVCGLIAMQDLLHVFITLIIPPAIFCYELLLVLPIMQAHSFHSFVGVFLLHNVLGNAWRGWSSSPKNYVKEIATLSIDTSWRTCEVCNLSAPPRSWHCSVCDKCVLKRDHHCNFFGSCIGYYNHRYFCMFVFHVFISTLYASCFNTMFMIYHFEWELMTLLSFTKFVFPLAAIVLHTTEESFHILFFIITLVSMCFTGFLLFYHGRVILRGQVTPEWKRNKGASWSNWKENIRDVLGMRWSLVWLSPWLPSPLPGDGIHWDTEILVKAE